MTDIHIQILFREVLEMNRKRKNYYAVLQLNFNDATITDALIRRRMSEMAYKMTRQEFCGDVQSNDESISAVSGKAGYAVGSAGTKHTLCFRRMKDGRARGSQSLSRKRRWIRSDIPMDLFRTIWGIETEPWDENECGNCHHYLAPGEQFCSHCGTRRGRRIFLTGTDSHGLYLWSVSDREDITIAETAEINGSALRCWTARITVRGAAAVR